MFPESDYWVLLYQEMTRRTAVLMQEQFANDVSSRFTTPNERRRKKNVPNVKLKTPVVFS